MPRMRKFSASNGGRRQDPSSSKNGAIATIRDYEDFQLFNPDDSEIEDEVDPDVRSLLINTYAYDASLPNQSSHVCHRLVRTNTRAAIAISAALVIGVIVCVVVLHLAWSRTERIASLSPSATYGKAAVATDGKPCAQIGVDVLLRNGTAVDAAIATLFCNGLYCSQSMGIGGGFLMTVYIKKTGETVTLNARETAPAAATLNMFHGNSTLSSKGPLSVAIPGEIRGYWEAKQRFGNGNVTWKSLIQPSIDMARNGITVSWAAAPNLRKERLSILADEEMRKIFVDPQTNLTLAEGTVYKREKLADTLERIADLGADEFYSGKTGQLLVEDLRKMGGILTLDDMKDYRVKWGQPVSTALNDDLVLHSVPLPGSGLVLTFILNVMKHFKVGPDDEKPLLYHRMVESFKWAYAYRSRLGDPADANVSDSIEKVVREMLSPDTAKKAFSKIDDDHTVNDPKFYGGDFYQPEDSGTSHTCVLAPNGDAVSVTSTINLHYGAGIMSPSTGVIYNDEMDDFSSPSLTNYFGLPPSETNFIRPGKRPLSSISPVIVVDRNTKNVRLVTGAAGGSRITTSMAQIAVRNVWLKQDIQTSIDSGRIHHQLVPNEVRCQSQVPQDVLAFLESRKHKVIVTDGFDSIVTGITAKEGKVKAVSDFRKDGAVAGF